MYLGFPMIQTFLPLFADTRILNSGVYQYTCVTRHFYVTPFATSPLPLLNPQDTQDTLPGGDRPLFDLDVCPSEVNPLPTSTAIWPRTKSNTYWREAGVLGKGKGHHAVYLPYPFLSIGFFGISLQLQVV